MNKSLFYSGLIALVVSISSFTVFNHLDEKNKVVKIEHVNNLPTQNALYTLDENGNTIPLDFNRTAVKVLDGVVHIKSTHLYTGNNQAYNYQSIPSPFRDFFGDEFSPFFRPENPNNGNSRAPTRVGTGSGVIISKDGYIVTNNHVIAEADDIEVTLSDNRTYKAVVVGADPSTDLALLQIKEKNLPVVPFVDSDAVKVGQWVMAVGNPMGLNSTVTAGIISAKGRNINILKDQYAVENFIQTDAAINPGNSGGALVDLQGGLIGINTAIASPTGTFAGYGFAVPANIVEKVVEDLLEYGMVQRGVLGIMIQTVDGNFAKDKGLGIQQGVYVQELMENSAAGLAGLQQGDVILSINGKTIKSSPELQGVIARHRPGESVELKVLRGDKEKHFTVVLNNREGSPDLTKKDDREIIKILGAELETIDKKLAKDLGLKGGVIVKKLFPGKLKKYTQMRDGFIITKVDGKAIDSVEELERLLKIKKGGVMLEGAYQDLPGEYFYAFGL